MLIIIGAIASGGDNTPKKVGENNNTNSNEADGGSNDSNTSTTYKVGDQIQLGKIILTVNSVETSQGGQYTKPSEGNTWLNTSLTIQNTGTNQEYISTLGQMFILDDQGNQYQVAVTNKALDNPGSTGLDGAVVAGAKKTGWVGFEVPKTAKGLKLQYNASFYSNKNITVDLGM